MIIRIKMIFKEKDTLFLMIDVQEKFGNIIFAMDEVLKNSNILNKSAEILGIPLIITEQYTKGLGSTCDSIYIPENTPIIEKFKFSSYTDEVAEIIKGIVMFLFKISRGSGPSLRE